MRKGFVALALAVIGLVAWSGSAGATRSNGSRSHGDFVVGTARLSASDGGGLFHFSAHSGPNGENPHGTYFAKNGIFGTTTFDSRVECLEVHGNLAYIGTRVTRSKSGPPKGDSVVFRVQDNGSPGAGKDKFIGTQGIDAATDCRNPALQAILTATTRTISKGNFTVHDG